MNDREKDAKLHELIYGVTPEMRICKREYYGWRDVQWFYSEKDKYMKRYGKYADEKSHGYSMQPCVPKKHSAIWDVVPNYTSDVAAAWKIEGDLAEFITPDYMANLVDMTRGNTVVSSPILGMWERERNLRRATPAQIVDALLLALGVQP